MKKTYKFTTNNPWFMLALLVVWGGTAMLMIGYAFSIDLRAAVTAIGGVAILGTLLNAVTINGRRILGFWQKVED